MEAVMEGSQAVAEISLSRPSDDTLLIQLAGNWSIGQQLPSLDEVRKQIDSGLPVQRLTFDSKDITNWDSGLVTFLVKLLQHCTERNIDADKEGLPEGVQRLLKLALAVPEKKDARRAALREPFLIQLGNHAMEMGRRAGDMLDFLGESFIAFGKLLTGKARFRRSDLTLLLQECGGNALGIVSFISLLVGLILAFVGAVQLEMFGAQIYVANLVGIAMAREMGALMAGIIMSGRTGAAFAAQIGTMQVNEEIDALKTMGISPMEFLVVPRMLALIVMMPLLTLYADLLGILGGAIVGVFMLDLSPLQYYEQTRLALNLTHFSIGIAKSMVFGIIIAVSGCLRGMESGRSASAVGNAATSAVVTSILFIVGADGLFAVITNVLKI